MGRMPQMLGGNQQAVRGAGEAKNGTNYFAIYSPQVEPGKLLKNKQYGIDLEHCSALIVCHECASSAKVQNREARTPERIVLEG
jgi:hypothetical protein